MKNGLLVLNVVLLIAIAVLFYLHFSSGTPTVKKQANNQQANHSGSNFKIAYFEMDSLENSFAMVKDVKTELGKKEDAITSELSRLEKTYQNKIAQYQAQGATMNQVQSENAQRDVMQMQQNMQNRKQALDKEYQDYYIRKMKDVKTKIEDFLKEYNNNKGYSYILASDPGLFYYRDTTYNITNELITGLNKQYVKKK